jgi:hypothetical protein
MAGWLQAAQEMQKTISCALEPSEFPETIVVVGWPEAREMRETLRDPTKNVKGYISVLAVGTSRNVSRYWPEATVTPFDATETITVNGFDITIGGIPTPGDNIFLYVNLLAIFNVHVDANDILADLATKLAAAVNTANAGFTATAVGTTVTLASGSVTISKFKCRAFGQGEIRREVYREQQRFQITVFAGDPATRDILASKAATVLASNSFLTLADGTQARVLYQSGNPEDFGMSAGLLTEKIFFTAEYPSYYEEKAARVGLITLDYGTDPPADAPGGNTNLIKRFQVF